MKPLLVAVVLLLSAPAGASAALDVYFNVDRDFKGVDAGQVLAREDGQFMPGGRMSVALERGGQIIATSSPDTGPIISGVVPQPGDRLHVVINGAERAVITFDGRPTIDGDCSPDGATVGGSFTPGSSIEAERSNAYGFAPERAAVTTDADRFTATFPRALRGSSFLVNSHATAPALDGSPVGVHARRSTAVSCAGGTGPVTEVKLGISRDKLRNVPVDRRGRFELTTRMRCPRELPTCRVTSGALAIKRNGDIGRSLGTRTYSVPGGTNRRLHGQLTRRALAALRRTGRRRVQFLIVIRPPVRLPDGIGARGLHGGYPGTLLAP